jgi:hypothetical protein
MARLYHVTCPYWLEKRLYRLSLFPGSVTTRPPFWVTSDLKRRALLFQQPRQTTPRAKPVHQVRQLLGNMLGHGITHFAHDRPPQRLKRPLLIPLAASLEAADVMPSWTRYTVP